MSRVVFLVTKEHERKRETADRQMQREERASEGREREAHLERERMLLQTPFSLLSIPSTAVGRRRRRRLRVRNFPDAAILCFL